MNTLWQDLRYGARMLLKQPGFTSIAVVTLALGIGATTAIFSVVNAVLLRPLPYHRPEQLVRVYSTEASRGSTDLPASYLNFKDWRDENGVWAHVAAYAGAGATFDGGDEPEQISGAVASGDLFAVLDVRPQAGRVFGPAEERPGGAKTVVISHGLWQRRFGSDPHVVGRVVTLDAEGYTVIGVMPPDFKFPLEQTATDFWVPPDSGEELNTIRGSNYLDVVARLKPGVSLPRAQAEVETIARRLEREYPESNAGRGVRLVPLHEDAVGDFRPALLLLLGAVGMVLLIACANVANLLLARAATRRNELAVRAALGASRARLVRQLLAESLLLYALGGALGLLLAAWGIDVVGALMPQDLSHLRGVGLDARVLAFTAGVTLVTGVAFGLIPAWQAARLDLSEAMKQGGRGAAESRGRARMRGALIVAELALSLVLLAGAGLLTQSFRRLLAVDPGFDPRPVLTADVSLPHATYPDGARQEAFFGEVLRRVSSLPGVRAVGVVSAIPLSNTSASASFTVEGRPPPAPGERLRAQYRVTSAAYLSVMGIPLLAGRALDERDRAPSPRVALVNETFARRYFPGEDPIGRRLRLSLASDTTTQIVGVIGDVKHSGLDVEARPECYLSYRQFPLANLTLVVRFAAADPIKESGAVRRAVRAVDPGQPIYEVKAMTQWVTESIARRRFSMLLLGFFAAAAVTLAAVGLFGVMSYLVAQRTHEIGIRMALGARPREVLMLVVGQGMRLTAAGVALGLAAALALTRLMTGLLYGVSAADPLTFAGVAGLLALVALVACYVAARRATKVDPLIALRYE